MDGYQLIMRMQQKLQDPNFMQEFNKITNELNGIPGLQQEVLKIAQIDDEKKRQKAIDKLPSKVKDAVKRMVNLINS